MEDFNNVYKDKTVLITGHTGFKGSWLSIWLIELGAKVVGYSLDVKSPKDNFVLTSLKDKLVDIRGDIRDLKKLKNVFDKYKPDYVFHLAAQPLVLDSYLQPHYTYEVNVMGTVNILECIRNAGEKITAILITTDKCYENKEQLWGYKETDPIGGYDPYSSSKGACELAVSSWRQSFMNPEDYDNHGIAIASVRAGNVIGGGDWSANRLIPDCIRALEDGKPIEIRNPRSVRPWQHVLDPLNGYLMLGQKLTEEPATYSGAWNFGPKLDSVVTVWQIGTEIIRQYGCGELADISDNDNMHEAQLLNLDISKAVLKLGWRPKLDIGSSIKYTIEWYKKYKSGNVYDLCKEQILRFMRQGE
ncbi:CDP-glucose 4,6-dehydratase [Sedimentibacter sp.]|uniref:CDP-glucose 4,6-dehydratase n=1 Tax=Sedimentibacter sp. TaxID=1960295 RepID=UPI00289970E2|nr:CDP-glucose 4,6-dehydratase [Sedimentibacter sp.]